MRQRDEVEHDVWEHVSYRVLILSGVKRDEVMKFVIIRWEATE
jgi:hypothetical protein